MQQQEPWRRLLLRTEATAQRYEAVLHDPSFTGCRLCADTESLEEYTYWRLMPNLFPYDRLCEKSDMLVTKRHTDEWGLLPHERDELLALKSGILAETYDSLLDHLPKQKSIPHHYHVHVVKFKMPEGA